MHKPFSAQMINGVKNISYNGNKIYPALETIDIKSFPTEFQNLKISGIKNSKHLYYIHKIDSAIFIAAIEYFNLIKANWCNLPLTTLMISSPGEVYAGQKLNYTTDTLPVELDWFNNARKIYLSESSQFYLELSLLLKSSDKVFSIYNSFRKEVSDTFHLSEFQHIEFEGKVDFKENVEILLGLLDYITASLINRCEETLEYFISEKEFDELETRFKKEKIIQVDLKELLQALKEDTKNDIYSEFTLKNFGAWEEIRCSEIYNNTIIATGFPILEIPFYHAEISEKNEKVAENADVIGFGYREIAGGGVRIFNQKDLEIKAEIFNLPLKDYQPYIESRSIDYERTAGFGLGWQRFVQWILKLPTIAHATVIPRSHHLPTI